MIIRGFALVAGFFALLTASQMVVMGLGAAYYRVTGVSATLHWHWRGVEFAGYVRAAQQSDAAVFWSAFGTCIVFVLSWLIIRKLRWQYKLVVEPSFLVVGLYHLLITPYFVVFAGSTLPLIGLLLWLMSIPLVGIIYHKQIREFL